MNKNCICRVRNVYRAIAAFETEFQKQLGLNINEAMLLCIVSEILLSDKTTNTI